MPHMLSDSYVARRREKLQARHKVGWIIDVRHPSEEACSHYVLMPKGPVRLVFDMMTRHTRADMQLVRAVVSACGVQVHLIFNATREQMVLTTMFHPTDEPFVLARHDFGPITLHQQPEGSLWNRLIEEDPAWTQ